MYNAKGVRDVVYTKSTESTTTSTIHIKFQPFSNDTETRRRARRREHFMCVFFLSLFVVGACSMPIACSHYAKHIVRETMQSIFEWRCFAPVFFVISLTSFRSEQQHTTTCVDFAAFSEFELVVVCMPVIAIF